MPAKILVVDDSASDRLIIQNMLREFNVLTASDGKEALDRIREHGDIDLMILDLNMPGMDGFQVLSTLGTEPNEHKLRTIILTNYDELENELMGLKLGAVDYIRKPIQMASLRARIEIHLELIRIQQLLVRDLHEQGLTFDVIFNQSPIGIAISGGEEPRLGGVTKFLTVNPMYEKITGRTQQELLEVGWDSFTHPDDFITEIRNYQDLLSGKIDSYAMEKRYIRPDGSIVWVSLIAATLKIVDQNMYKYICLVQNITRRKTMEKALVESERSKAVLLSHLPGLAYRCNYDADWTMQFVSDGCLELTGYAPEKIGRAHV